MLLRPGTPGLFLFLSGPAGDHAPQVVRYILRNERYTGTLVIKYDHAGVRKNRLKAMEERVHKKLRPESEWLYMPVPALVTKDVFLEAQARLKAGTSEPRAVSHR